MCIYWQIKPDRLSIVLLFDHAFMWLAYIWSGYMVASQSL